MGRSAVLAAALLGILVGGAAGAEERSQPLLLVLRGRNAAALDRWIARRHARWLDPASFGRRFGATPAAVSAATRWLGAHGLRVRRAFAGRTLIEFDGPRAAVTAAFGVRLGRAHGRLRSARPPILPAELGALAVLGLEDARVVPRFTVRPAAITPSGERFYISPQDFRRIYGLDSPAVAGLDGAGERISIPAIGAADDQGVASFRTFFGLPPSSVSSVVAGDDPGPGRGDFHTEATLDVTWAGAVAPAATVELVRGTDLFPILAHEVNEDPAPIVSISLTLCVRSGARSLARAADLIFQQAAAQGQTVLVASGDTGAFGCYGRRGVDVFGASPHVTAVGGTIVEPLRDGAGNAIGYGSERVWNVGDLASGGGRSPFFRRPAWQAHGAGRAVPDVAAPADDYPLGIGERVICCVGGTSASAPAWAGVVALLDQARGARLGLLNPRLYALGRAQRRGGPGAFHDVVKGSSALRVGKLRRPGFRAHPGFDLATGWGSPDVPALLTALGGS